MVDINTNIPINREVLVQEYLLSPTPELSKEEIDAFTKAWDDAIIEEMLKR